MPRNVRVMLVLTMAFLITPTVSNYSRLIFDKLDANRDGVLTRDEVPPSMLERYDSLRESAGNQAAAGLTANNFRITLQPPRTIIEYAWTAVGELGRGLCPRPGHAHRFSRACRWPAN